MWSFLVFVWSKVDKCCRSENRDKPQNLINTLLLKQSWWPALTQKFILLQRAQMLKIRTAKKLQHLDLLKKKTVKSFKITSSTSDWVKTWVLVCAADQNFIYSVLNQIFFPGWEVSLMNELFIGMTFTVTDSSDWSNGRDMKWIRMCKILHRSGHCCAL